jgi:hypothetical protein
MTESGVGRIKSRANGRHSIMKILGCGECNNLLISDSLSSLCHKYRVWLWACPWAWISPQAFLVGPSKPRPVDHWFQYIRQTHNVVIFDGHRLWHQAVECITQQRYPLPTCTPMSRFPTRAKQTLTHSSFYTT